METCCTDEKQVKVMQEALGDVGKWVFYVLKAARTANVPWPVLREGIRKAGAWEGYTRCPRTGDLTALAKALVDSDMVKAYGGELLSSDGEQFELKLSYNPMMRMAASCTDNQPFLEELAQGYVCFFEGLLATYGLKCGIRRAPSAACDEMILVAKK